ncbi:MAG TPA: [NiFe]-hydrogenase assembly chaperone HybE [Candidatus Limnocylindria bacterium]|nr:[NiFe]-hydrogenase assembly chaperone HybE [Candidatus Limnocylindria bacterium]
MRDTAELVRCGFERISEDLYAAAGEVPRIHVEVVDAGSAAGARVMVAITPWTLVGVVLSADERFPSSLVIGGRRYLVHTHELDGIGPYRAVALSGTGAHFPSQVHARKVARTVAPLLLAAVARARGHPLAA